MIEQTPDGFLWLATDHGLFRFDGQSFELYRPSSGESFPDDVVRILAATADGGLWIGYARAGASFLKDGRNINYGELAGLGLNGLFSIAVDDENTVWIATSDGLKRRAGASWEFIGPEWNYPAKTRTTIILIDKRGTLWAGTRRGVFYLRKGERTFRPVPDLSWEVTQFAQAPNGTLWLASPDAPIRALDPLSGTFRRDTPPIDIRPQSIAVARDGCLWITTRDHGLIRVPSDELPVPGNARVGDSIERYSKSDGLSSNFSFQALEDREGSVWVGTSAGLDQFRELEFSAIEPPDGTSMPTVSVADAGRFFYGGALVEARTGQVLKQAPPLAGGVSTTYRDTDNVAWFGGWDHLWKMSDGVFADVNLPIDLGFGRRVQSIAKDRVGGLWVSIVRNGVYRLYEGRWTKVTSLEAAPDNLCRMIMVDTHNRIWFTYSKDNQVQVLAGQTLTTYGVSDGIDLGFTTTVDEIDGHIVIGGKNGVAVLQGTRFHRLRLADNARIFDVSGVVRQETGDLWINQGSGIIHIAADDFQSALANPELPMRFRLFDYLDGLDEQPTLPNPLPSIHDGGDGLLYFSMGTRVLVKDTANSLRNTLRPAVAIVSILADSKEFISPTDVTLLPNTDRVTIRYSASSLLIPQRVQFRYRLEGLEQGWRTGEAQRSALYSKLPPGHYVFRVLASNNDGLWNEQGASVSLTIPPSLVQTWQFKVLCIALAAALSWLLYRVRLQQLTAQMRGRLYERLDERMQISRDLHDTFFQSVQGLLLRINTAASLLKKDDQARVILDDALKQSDRVMTEGREIMLDLRGEGGHGALGDDLSTMGEDYKSTHSANFRVAVIGDPRPLHPIAYEEIYRFGREAIANAFRHAHAETIEVELYYERTLLRLRVRDDGLGIDPEILDRGYKAAHWGLPGMRERAKRLGGHVELWSRMNAGTEIELRVPGAAAYRNDARRHWFAWFTRGARESEEVSTKK